MALTLDATIGGASANTYCTLAAIDAYADQTFPVPTDWVALGPDDATRSLLAFTAAQILDRERFPGVRVDVVQIREWPRNRVRKPDAGGAYNGFGMGYGTTGYYLPTEIPEPILHAQALIAFWLASQADGFDPFAATFDGGVSSLQLGGDYTVTSDPEAAYITSGSRFLQATIRPLLLQTGLVYAPSVRTVRG